MTKAGTPPDAAATRHGGGLMKAATAFPDAPGTWLDLSTGINPDPWRGPRADFDSLSRLPDPMALQALEEVAASAFGVDDPTRIAAVAGAETAIRLSPIMLKTRAVAIVGPTYGAHEEAWRAAGADVSVITADQARASEADALVLVNPNNPDGRVFSRADLIDLAEARSRAGRFLIVDESFVETTPEISVADRTDDGLIVLRSFGKFYGLAGVRLGFMIARPDLNVRLRGLTGDWPVSADALVMGAAAYADADWRETTRERLTADAMRLDAVLVRAGFEVVGGTSLFRLARRADAQSWFRRLCEQEILTRPFDYAPDWLRFGVPDAAGLARLRKALEVET